MSTEERITVRVGELSKKHICEAIPPTPEGYARGIALWERFGVPDMAQMLRDTALGQPAERYEAVEIAPDRWEVTRWFKDRHTDSQVIRYELPDNANRTRVEGAIGAAIASSHRFKVIEGTSNATGASEETKP